MVWPVATHFVFPPPFPPSLLRLIFLGLSDASGQVAPRSLYFGWCEKWAAVPYHPPGRPWSDLTRVVDKPLTGRPPTKIGARRTSSDEARNAAAQCCRSPTSRPARPAPSLADKRLRNDRPETWGGLSGTLGPHSR